MRKPAAEKLRGTAKAYLTAAQSQDARYAHIDAADKQKVGHSVVGKVVLQLFVLMKFVGSNGSVQQV